MEALSVSIRVRPPIKQESCNSYHWQVSEGENSIYLCNTDGTPVSGQPFSFDHVFGAAATNRQIYELHAKDVVQCAVRGFNGTIFAYGQTSTGKTYTMKGTLADPGITRLAAADVFSAMKMFDKREFLVRVSYMEIYNEEINDLLAPESRKLPIHESLDRGVFVAGLMEEIVDSPEQVLELLDYGEAHRHYGETNMNVYSSRSHTIFRMVVESRSKSEHANTDNYFSDAVRVSALNMVDLAGSERIAKTGAGGVRLKEGGHINKSLMTLGTVINKLSDGGKQGAHIPYRDSKLTRILQPALGGNAKTAIICTIATDEVHMDETRGTLQFASRAKKVTNCAEVNEIITDAALLKRQKKEIEELRSKLQGNQHSEDLEKELLLLRKNLLKFECEKECLALELQKEKKFQAECQRRLKEQQEKIESLSTLVSASVLDNPDPYKQDPPFDGQNTFYISKRSKRPSDLPPSFGELVGDEWSENTFVEDEQTWMAASLDNIADEDIWNSLNKEQSSPEAAVRDMNGGFAEETSDASRISLLEELERCREEGETFKSRLVEVLAEKEVIQKKFDEQLKLQTEMELAMEALKIELSQFKSSSRQNSLAGNQSLDFCSFDPLVVGNASVSSYIENATVKPDWEAEKERLTTEGSEETPLSFTGLGIDTSRERQAEGFASDVAMSSEADSRANNMSSGTSLDCRNVGSDVIPGSHGKPGMCDDETSRQASVPEALMDNSNCGNSAQDGVVLTGVGGLKQKFTGSRVEQERIFRHLVEQLSAHEISMEYVRLEKVRLAKELKKYKVVVARHDKVVEAICESIKEFEEEMVGIDLPSQTGS